MSAPAPLELEVWTRSVMRQWRWILEARVRRLTIPSARSPQAGGSAYGPRRGTPRGRRASRARRGSGRWPASLDELVVESELLAGNPLGDPARRPLYVYRSPGVARRGRRDVPSVYVIQGFTGQVDMWLGAHRVRADDRSSGSTRCSPPANAPTRSSCSSTRGPRAAARSS